MTLLASLISAAAYNIIRLNKWNSPVVQWLGLHAFTAKGMGLIPGRGAKIPQAKWCGQKKKD